MRRWVAAGLIFANYACPAADAFYLGTWKIASAVVAPWADPQWKLDPPEMKSLVGKTVVNQPKAIVGPRALACRAPHYQVRDDPADTLFQGAFGEMQRRDSSLASGLLQ